MLKRNSVTAALLLCIGLLGVTRILSAAEPMAVSSPDGNLTISLALKALPQPYLPGKRAYYSVSYKGKLLLTDSPLGLDFLGASPLAEDFEVISTDRQSHSATWENPFGTKRRVPDNYKQLTVSLHERRPPAGG